MAESNNQKGASRPKQIHAVVDRVEENDVAVLLLGDDEKWQVDVPLSLLPDGANDGDHLKIIVSIDKESREEASDRVKSLQDKLTQKSGGQDQKDFKL